MGLQPWAQGIGQPAMGNQWNPMAPSMGGPPLLGLQPQQISAPPPPDADKQRAELIRAEKAAKDAAAESSAFVGVIARFSHTTGIGYIECGESMTRYGGDVQIQRTHFSGLEVGDTVVFTVTPGDRGQPQASFCKRLSELTQARRLILELEAPFPAPGTVESAQEYLGFITTFQPDRGFGFVSCAQTRQMYGSDVYIHRDQFLDVQVGDGIHFRVALNPKGMPVARGVRKTVAPEPTPAPAPVPVEQPPAVVRPEVQKMMAMAGFRAPGEVPAADSQQAAAADPARDSKRRARSASRSSMEVSRSPDRRRGDKERGDAPASAGGADKKKSRRSPSRDSSRSSRSRSSRSRSRGSRSRKRSRS